MAQFYGETQGNRSVTSRMGTKNSGLWGHIRGWEVGVRVEMIHVNGEDRAVVTLTSGSNGGPDKIIGTYKAADLAE